MMGWENRPELYSYVPGRVCGAAKAPEPEMILHCASPLVAFFRTTRAAPTHEERKGCFQYRSCVLVGAKVWVNTPRSRDAVPKRARTRKRGDGDEERARCER